MGATPWKTPEERFCFKPLEVVECSAKLQFLFVKQFCFSSVIPLELLHFRHFIASENLAQRATTSGIPLPAVVQLASSAVDAELSSDSGAVTQKG